MSEAFLERMHQSILPWQLSVWQDLYDRYQNKRLPHALLFTGVPGLGQWYFAKQFAKALLCYEPDVTGFPCGNCAACRWLKANTHPDWFEVEPEVSGKMIKIDQIRQLVDFNYKTARAGKYKIILINQIESLNRQAANALLKTLEEPADNTLIILVTPYPALVLKTISSRCQMVSFPVPDREMALSWLKEQAVGLVGRESEVELNLLLSLLAGSPLQVIDALENKELQFRQKIWKEWQAFTQSPSSFVSLAEIWGKEDVMRLLAHLDSWVIDSIRLYYKADSDYIVNKDLMAALTKTMEKVSIRARYDFLDELKQLKQTLQSGLPFNKQSLIENLLMRWIAIHDQSC